MENVKGDNTVNQSGWPLMATLAAVFTFLVGWSISFHIGQGIMSHDPGILLGLFAFFALELPAIAFVVAVFAYFIVEGIGEDRLCRERAEQEKQEKEEFAVRLNALLRSGSLIPRPDNAIIACANGHRYRLKDFVIHTTRVEYEAYTESTYDSHGNEIAWRDVQRPYAAEYCDFGCPFCKTTLCSFENAVLNHFCGCPKCKYWYDRREYSTCPLCQPADDSHPDCGPQTIPAASVHLGKTLSGIAEWFKRIVKVVVGLFSHGYLHGWIEYATSTPLKSAVLVTITVPLILGLCLAFLGIVFPSEHYALFSREVWTVLVGSGILFGGLFGVVTWWEDTKSSALSKSNNRSKLQIIVLTYDAFFGNVGGWCCLGMLVILGAAVGCAIGALMGGLILHALGTTLSGSTHGQHQMFMGLIIALGILGAAVTARWLYRI